MNVTDAVAKRISVRAFRPDPVPAETVREILSAAARSPSGGNLQPWRVRVLAGEPLAVLKRAALERLTRGEETPEYSVYPPNLWEPLKARRWECGEDLYAAIGVPRENRPARLRQFARNAEFFGAPVGMFFTLDRRVGAPQWADVGMFMQTIMLLAVERGLDTCAQEFWARLHGTVGAELNLPEDEMLFCGMALGFRDETHPINTVRTRREPVEAFATMTGF